MKTPSLVNERSKRPIAFDRHPATGARVRLVPECLVRDAAVVPEGDRMGLPGEPHRESVNHFFEMRRGDPFKPKAPGREPWGDGERQKTRCRRSLSAAKAIGQTNSADEDRIVLGEEGRIRARTHSGAAVSTVRRPDIEKLRP